MTDWTTARVTPETLAELRRAALIEGHDAAHYPTSVVVPTRTLLALLDAASERDALAAKVERVRALADEWTYNGEFGWDDGSHAYGPDCEGQALDYAAAKLRRALDEEPQP